MQQQLIFSITHSMHTLQPINIPSDVRFNFCFAFFLKLIIISYCEPSFILGRAEPPIKLSKSKSLVIFQSLEEGCCKRGSAFYRASSFYRKKLKSELFNDKKFIKKNIFL